MLANFSLQLLKERLMVLMLNLLTLFPLLSLRLVRT